MSRSKTSYSDSYFWQHDNSQRKSSGAPVKSALVNDFKTAVAKGPVYGHSGEKVQVQVAEPTNVKPSAKTLKVNNPIQQKVDKSKLLLDEVCVKDKELQMMLTNYRQARKIDPRTGGLVAHMTPLLISYYDQSGEDRYPLLSSRKFQDQVKNYYKERDINASFRNDSDNEHWRIYLYPQ
ncbi:hypothetical protein Catovirus_2_64 [Catovirus CTV1]|uniref:Uncharacterized protein n=1 Tax=Catovirus CTV1 TaxID=1977631 RepID=A0A1V0SBM0_9VIRU|nr:hypothetical protein Catovirus_2_64 [Catovirus CTV1]